jgi:hypothetical protein
LLEKIKKNNPVRDGIFVEMNYLKGSAILEGLNI